MKTVLQQNVNMVDKNSFGHPTIKPLEFVKNHIINSTKKGDIILDTFLGSGTTAVACKETGRQYIGFEIDKEYFKIAQDRLNGIEKSGQTTLDLFSEQTSMEFDDE